MVYNATLTFAKNTVFNHKKKISIGMKLSKFTTDIQEMISSFQILHFMRF